MGADIPDAQPMRSAYLSLAVQSDAEAERIFSALSDGGEVFMQLQETFFATRFAQLRDRFGINWMIIHERPMAQRPQVRKGQWAEHSCWCASPDQLRRTMLEFAEQPMSV